MIFFLLPLVILRRNKKPKKITSTTKNLEHMTAKRERERVEGGGGSQSFPLPWIRPCYRLHENEKKRFYSWRVLDIEHGTFTPLVFKTTGAMGKECLGFPRRLTELIAIEKGEHYAPIKSKLQHPSPRANPGHLTIFCARGLGNLICKAFQGDLTFAWVWWGKLNQNCQFFFFRALKSLTCLDEM